MAWIRLEDTFPEHTKIDAAGGDAAWLHVCAIGYCNRNRTDGFIATNRVARLSDRRQPLKLADRLCEVGLWEAEIDGYRIHDYLHYNPSKAELDAADAERSRKKSEAGKLGGIASGIARRKHNGSNGEAEAKQTGSRSERNTNEIEAPTRPDPTRPDLPLSSSTSSPVTRTPSSLDDAKVTEALRLYADAETARYGKGPKYRSGILKNAEHWAQLVALNHQRPDCTPQALANAHAGGEGWPVNRRGYNAHPPECQCQGTRKVRDEAGYMADCTGVLRMVAG